MKRRRVIQIGLIMDRDVTVPFIVAELAKDWIPDYAEVTCLKFYGWHALQHGSGGLRRRRLRSSTVWSWYRELYLFLLARKQAGLCTIPKVPTYLCSVEHRGNISRLVPG